VPGNARTIEAARDAAHAYRWAEADRLFRALDPADLDGPALDDLADTCWWSCRLDDSIAARQRAYARYHGAGRSAEAAMAAWRLFDAHLMAGRARVAAGWLRCARSRLDGVPECAVHGYLAFADAETAFHRSDLAAVWESAGRMVVIGDRYGDPDLAAMGTVVKGRTRIAEGLLDEGLGLLDEAMCAVLAEETSPLFTGWIHCLVVADCFALGDLDRAEEWTEAAMTWCESLEPEAPYRGMCRIKRVELSALRGALDEAERECRRACEELLAYQPASAAEGYTVLGEILRRRGAATDAERAFDRARDLGGDDQPGLALVRLALGDADTAVDMLTGRGPVAALDPVGRARHLAAFAEIAHARGDLPGLKYATAGLAETARGDLEGAAADMSTARLRLMEGRPEQALDAALRARRTLEGIGLPFEAAQARMLAGSARADAGDLPGARRDWGRARAEFARVGARTDADRAAGLLGPSTPLPYGLTARECEVLRLVATGGTNRSIAVSLGISEHTVARHLNNVFAKLGVSSRAAATAVAFQAHLV
jgi:ATP/maltotriose-dependent transcriptional regulator MalT